MFTLFGPRSSRRHCDGIVASRFRPHRRSRASAAYRWRSSWPLEDTQAKENTQARSASESSRKRHKSLIMIYLCGGPPHQDMYDLKIDAPAEDPRRVRSDSDRRARHRGLRAAAEYRPDHGQARADPHGRRLPRRSRRLSVLHRPSRARTPPAGGWPHIGSSSSRLQGPVAAGIPPFVSLCYVTQHKPYNEPSAGFLGLGHNAFRPMGEGRDDLVLQGITADRLGDRKNLLSSVDQFRRQWDGSRTMDGLDTFTQRAMGILTSSEFFDALDITQGRPEDSRPLRPLRPQQAQGRRRAARAAEPAPRPAADRSRRSRRHGQLQLLGLARAELQERRKTSCPIFDKAFRPSSKTCTSAAWPTTAPSSPGANSAARPRSTKTPAATTGRASRALCWPAAA